MVAVYLAYARQYLQETGGEKSRRPGSVFRRRSGHLARVTLWAERLMEQGGVPDAEALRLAAAFHDIGYGKGAEGHASRGAEILRAYALANGLPLGTAGRAAFLVAEHSHKSDWLRNPAVPRDLLYLMEADLLDEEGAMGLVWDCAAAIEQKAEEYVDVLSHMRKHELSRLGENPMVTPLARRYWEEKQALLRAFLTAFAFDLGVPDET